jgi:hypothetical protein
MLSSCDLYQTNNYGGLILCLVALDNIEPLVDNNNVKLFVDQSVDSIFICFELKDWINKILVINIHSNSLVYYN